MELKQETLAKFKDAFLKDETLQATERAVFRNGILASAQNDNVIDEMSFVFSVDVDQEAVANQKQSGRCWMFAALNTLRIDMEKRLKLKKGSFQLSQNYNFFFDKLEKANYFYEQIIASADSSLDDRRVTFLLSTPQQDGGDWPIIAPLIEKYGVMPLTAMGDTSCSVNSSEMDTVLNRKMRQDALQLRTMVRDGKSDAEVAEAKESMLGDIYKICAVCLGVPPETFDFEYRDVDGNFHGDYGLTPQEFYKKYCRSVSDFVAVTNVPTDATPYNRMFTIDMANEVEGYEPVRYLNVEMDVLKDLTIKQLQGGDPVWFGCDVLQSSDRYKGIMAIGLYDLEALFGIKDTMNKSERYLMRESLPTHAMVIGGVNIVDGKPTKWKVENSWGSEAHGQKVGFNGYFIMNDEWMDEYTYEVVILKDLLPDDLKAVLDTEPVVLPYWSTFNPVP